MASIQKRKNVWQVRIRVQGFPTLARSFEFRKAAQVWANEKDNEQLRGVYRDESDAQKTSLGHLTDRHLVDVTPLMKGAAEDEYKLRALQRTPLSHLAISKRTPLYLRSIATCAFVQSPVERSSANSLTSHLSSTMPVPNGVSTSPTRSPWSRKPASPQGGDRVLNPEERATRTSMEAHQIA